MKNIFKHNIQFLLSSATALSLVACTAKNTPRTQHEGAVEQGASVPDATQAGGASTASSALTMEDLNKLDLQSIYQKVSNEKASKEELLNAVQVLKPFILNQKFLENPRVVTTTRASAALAYFNEALLKLEKLKANEVDVLLPEYLVAVQGGCNEELKGCQNIAFFRTDYRSTKVLEQIVRRLDAQLSSGKEKNEGIVKYYQVLMTAMELKNHIKDNDLDFLYLKRARDYASYLSSLPDQEKQKSKLTKHASLFESIFANYPLDLSNSSLREFVVNFKPWLYSKLEPDLFPFGTKKMFSYAAMHFLYDEKGELNKDFKQVLVQSQQQNDRLGESFFKIVQNMNQSEQTKIIFKTLNLESQKIQNGSLENEYFYMVDRLYRGHLGIEEVGLIWQGSKKDVSKLLEVVDYYTKIQILKRIAETNQYMSDMYAKRDEDSLNLFRMTLEKSKKLSEDWMEMLSRFDQIAVFMGSHLKSEVQMKDKVDDALQSMSAIKRNIKYLSVYPNMMLLAYFITKAEGKIIVDTWFGRVEITPDMIVNSILEGEVQPWFRFGNDDFPINKYEMAFAYHFALSTGTFETFAQKKDEDGSAAVDRKKFFQKVLLQYLTTEKNSLELSVKNVKEKFVSQNSYNTLLRVCEYEKRGNKNYSLNTNLEDVQYFAFSGNGKVGLSAAGQKIYSDTDLSPDIVIPSLRKGLDKKLVLVKTMAAILRYNMEVLGANEVQMKDVVEAVENQIKEIDSLRLEYYQEAMKAHRQLSGCLNSLYDLEVERQNKLVDQEIQHLGLVYDALNEINQLKQYVKEDEIEKKTKEINAKFNFTDGLDQISAEGYRYTHLNLLLRMRNRMQSMTPAVIVELPPDLTRSAVYGNSAFISARDNEGNLLKKEDFIKQGALKLNGTDNPFLFWMQGLTNKDDRSQFVSSRSSKISSMVELYKYANELGITDATQKIKTEEIISEALGFVKKMNITQEDEKRLSNLGLNRRVSLEDVRGVLLHKTTLEPISIFDFIYENLSNNMDQLAEAREFYVAVTNVGRFSFTPDKKVEGKMQSFYKPLVTTSENYVKEFENSLHQAEQSLAKSGAADLRIRWEMGSADYKPAMSRDGSLQLLSPLKIQDFSSRMKDFKEKLTRGYYK